MAIESGSRVWGFAAPDSDYDVRFIYIRRKEDYLKLENVRDVIEWKLDEVLDINGWDIKKALQLLHNSNPTVFEWCASPIIYMEREEFGRLKEILPEYFSAKKGLYHYWHTASRTYKDYLLGEEIKVKKYFYVLRPMLAAKWILDKRTAPPMLFEELMEAELDDSVKDEVDKLLEMKKKMSEMGTASKIEILDQYILRTLDEIKAEAEKFEDKATGWEKLDEFFLSVMWK